MTGKPGWEDWDDWLDEVRLASIPRDAKDEDGNNKKLVAEYKNLCRKNKATK